MGILKNIIILGFLLFILSSQVEKSDSTDPAESQDDINSIPKKSYGDNEAIDLKAKRISQALVHSTLPTLSMILFMTPAPLGPILGVVAAMFYTGYVVHEASAPTGDYKTAMAMVTKMRDIEKQIAMDSKKVIDELTYVMTGGHMLTKMRKKLETLEATYNQNLGCILNTSCLYETRESILKRMMDPMDDFNQDLLTFNIEYMSSKKNDLQGLDSESSFYDYVLQKNRKMAANNLNCHNQSDQTNIIKACFYITEVLTNSFAMVVGAYMARYQQKLKTNETELAQQYEEAARATVEQHLKIMEVIISDTHWAMGESSRDIRTCDPRHHMRSETYERLTNFIRAQLVIVEDQDPFRNFHYWTDKSKRQCRSSNLNEPSLNFEGSKLINCTKMDEDIYDVYTNPSDPERLYSYFTRTYSNPYSGRYGQIIKIFGNTGEKKSHHILLSRLGTCSLSLCYAYKEGQVKFSTKLVEAREGYVITGIRWRIINQTVYMQIQEGEFIDFTRVDAKTVEWQSISIDENDDVIVLNETQRAIILDDAVLPSQTCVTGVQLVLVEGMMTLKVVDSMTNGYDSDSTLTIYAQTSDVSKMTEINLKNADIPERAAENQMNVVVSNPGRHFVKFQPSGLQEDAGQTTIPYLDIQDVITQPPAPIGGIGIYYKRVANFGGFIGLKMISADLSFMVKTEGYEKFSKAILNAFKNVDANTTNLDV